MSGKKGTNHVGLPRGVRPKLHGGGVGRKFTRHDREMIMMKYFELGSYLGVARYFKIDQNSVRRIVHESDNDPELRKVRARVYDAVAGRLLGMSDRVLGSIDDEELKTTKHLVRDEAGQVVKVVQEGPSLRDKAMAVGVLTDKAAVLAGASSEARGETVESDGLMLPGDLEAAKAMLARKIKSIRLLDVQFDDGKAQRIEEQARKVGVTQQMVEEAEVEADFTEGQGDEYGPFD